MADPVVTESPPAPKMPWEQEWMEKPKQAIINAVETVKEAVGSIRMPWERDWTEKPRATSPEAPKPAVAPSKGFDMKSYTSKLIQAESGGVATAKAKTSSATGLAQFTKGTWLEQVTKQGLDYTLNDRTNPEKVKVVLEGFTKQNMDKARKELGREPTQTEMYMYHFVPAKASELIKADPDTPATRYVSEAVVKANKPIFLNKEGRKYTTPKTVGEVMSIFRKKMKEE